LDEILTKYTPLVLKMASLLSNGDPHLKEDLTQEGYIALYHAIRYYRKDRGSFPAFAKKCVRNAMISYLRKNKARTKDLISLESPSGSTGRNEPGRNAKTKGFFRKSLRFTDANGI